MFLYLEQLILSLAKHLPLELFAPVASCVEELIPPIPSPSVVILTGSMSQIQNYTFVGAVILIFLAAVGKTIGASVVYFVADKAEDFLSKKISKFTGLTHEQIESFGARLSKNWKDYIILIVLRALPIVPSTLISVGGGLLKIKFKLFVITTFVGSLIRDTLYFYLGYFATVAVTRIFVENTKRFENIIQIIVVIFIVLFLAFLYFRNRKAKD